MAVKLIANYAKRLGLPGYSSHQFSVSIETELPNLETVARDSERLYESLQGVVDQQIQKTGFVPAHGYGLEENKNSEWQCSQKQRALIEKIMAENKLDEKEVEELARERFTVGLRELNKLQASGLIDELLERHGNGNGNRANRRGRRFSQNGGSPKGATA
jgi:hypothetical protein